MIDGRKTFTYNIYKHVELLRGIDVGFYTAAHILRQILYSFIITHHGT